jgi:hypothetical protein
MFEGLFSKRSLKMALRILLYGKKHPHWIGVYEFEHRDKDGNLIDKWTVENALADEGEENMLDAYLRAQNVPTTFYMALYNDTPVETDTLADLTGEPSTNGYARQEIERSTVGWPALALDSGDYMATSKQVTFSASGGSWGPVTYMVLCDVASGTSGKLISYVALSQSRTLQDSEALGCKMKIKLQ